MGRKRKENASADASIGAQEDKKHQQKSLYDTLELEQTATQVEIKKAYHRLALKLHPDKNPGDEEAKEKFQTLQKIYAVLGDPEKRKVYDETGSIDDTELTGEKFNDLYSYYRTVFKKVEVDDIEAAELEYRGSEEEKKDLKDLYVRFKGNMNMVYNWLICSRPEMDSHRFMAILNDAIATGELKEFKVYKMWASDTAKKPAPEEPLQQKPRNAKRTAGAELNGLDLKALISSRQQRRGDDIFAALEKKYASKGKGEKAAKGGKGRKGKDAFDEPSEEEFQAAQTRVLQGGVVKKSKHRAGQQ